MSRQVIAIAALLGAGLVVVWGAGGVLADEPKVGEQAPAFSLPGSDGKIYTLADYKGKSAVVLAWFPKAFTGGCTAECKSFAQGGNLLKGLNVAYFTASVDVPDYNKKFAESLNCDYPILSDADKSVAKAYGVVHENRAVPERLHYGCSSLSKGIYSEQNMAPAAEAPEPDALGEKMDEAALALSEQTWQSGDERFLLLAEAAPFFICIAGPDALCTYFNRAWLDLRGRKLSEETGNGWTEGLHPDDHNLCLEAYLKAFSARQPYHITARVLRATGEYAWVEGAGSPYFARDSSFLGYLGVGVDITERKRAVFTPDTDAVRLVCTLTERERQVLALIADGRSTKEAAVTLGISYKTADSHRSRILEKLGVHETASMVRYAIRAGLIVP